jgi:hypothetical protein
MGVNCLKFDLNPYALLLTGIMDIIVSFCSRRLGPSALSRRIIKIWEMLRRASIICLIIGEAGLVHHPNASGRFSKAFRLQFLASHGGLQFYEQNIG